MTRDEGIANSGPQHTLGFDRREFIRKLLAIGVGAPAAMGLAGALSGCDTFTGQAAGGTGTLQEVVNKCLADLQALLNEVRVAESADDETREGWLDVINRVSRDLWAAVADAGQAERHAAVHPEMTDYLARLDEWEVPLRTPQEVRQWTLADLHAAAARTATILNAHPTADVPALMIFVLIGCLVRPFWDDSMIYGTALSASDEDTENVAAQVYNALRDMWSGKADSSRVNPADFSPLELPMVSLCVSMLEGLTMMWLWAIMCNVAEDPSMYFAYIFLMVLLMMLSGYDRSSYLRNQAQFGPGQRRPQVARLTRLQGPGDQLVQRPLRLQ
ncbi:MAG: hypothetical protein J7M38_00485, partial [Armatimonadetes bacterium]|nr:hypothetical protein [Armatimonadota bacterium]